MGEVWTEKTMLLLFLRDLGYVRWFFPSEELYSYVL